jgi:hypothetical protein
VKRIALTLALLTALLGGAVGCTTLDQPPNPALDQKLRAYEATRSWGGD